MNIKDFNEALYASSNGVVVERRKNIVVPLLVLLAGVAPLLVVNYFIENGTDANNLKSALVLVGGCVTLVGAALCGVCVFGAGEPYHTGDKCTLSRRQYSFDRAQHNSVVKAIEACDKLALDGIEESDIAGISVLCYYSPRSKYVAAQAFAYEEFVYKPITELNIKA